MTLIPRTLLLLLIAAPLLAQQPAPAPTAAQTPDTAPAKAPDQPVPPQMQQAVPSPQPAPVVTSGDRADVYKGLITTLHDGGENKAALAQLQSMPPEILARLSVDPDFLVASAGIYSALGDNSYALRLLDAAEGRYTFQRKPVPLGIQIQACYLLLKIGDDSALHTRLFYVTQLAERADSLTPEQSSQLNDLWIYFALRRASEESNAGNRRAALRILITAYETYPDNALIKRSLAGTYLNAGDAKTSLQLYKEVGLADASPSDYQGAIGAAFAAGDRQDAEKWLRLLLEKSPTDPTVLTLAAKLEQARGNRKLAARYYRAALENMPKEKRALNIPATLHDDAAPTAQAPLSPLTTLASVTDPSPARESAFTISNTPTPAVHSYGNVYLPGEQIAPVLVPIFIPQRDVAAPATPARPVASAVAAPERQTLSGRARPTLRRRYTAAASGRADAGPRTRALYHFSAKETERLGDYDPAR